MTSPRLFTASPRTAALACWAALLVLPGCLLYDDDEQELTPPPNRVLQLAELPRGGVQVAISLSTVPVPNRPLDPSFKLALKITYDGDGGMGVGPYLERYCPTMHPSFAVTLDGAPISVTERGRWMPAGLEDQFRCLSPSVEIPITPALRKAGSVLVIRDDSRDFDVPLGDLLVDRQLELSGRTDWDFTEGETVAVKWTPAADLSGQPATRFVVHNGGPGEYFSLGNGKTSGDTLSFTLPASAPWHGQAFFEFQLERAPQSCGATCVVTASYKLARVAVLRAAPRVP